MKRNGNPDPPTFNDYLLESMVYGETYTDQRAGQVLFNSLVQMRPDLAEQVRGSDLDPFHRDERIDEFLEWVIQHWTASPAPDD